MTINYSEGLNKLRTRRLGLDRGDAVEFMESLGHLESYERRQGKIATRYALGAMQEVDPAYTKISLEEAEKVQEALTSGLNQTNIQATYRLQGSVPLNVHIKGASDVDLLVIEERFLTYDRGGHLAKNGHYSTYNGRGNLTLDLLHLRESCEGILQRKYWGSDIDVSGDKSIRLSGGGFRREVDVVPAHWHDNALYQEKRMEIYRIVAILDKSVPKTIENWPFLYRARIDERNANTDDGLKMSIRLLKNLKNDSNKDIELNSYDIGGLMWNCPPQFISSAHGKDLAVLSGTDKWLDTLATNYSVAALFDTPDQSRKVIDSQKKFQSLGYLAQEASALADAVYAELAGVYYGDAQITPNSRRSKLEEAYIPTA